MKAISYDCHKVYFSVQLLNLQLPSWYACDWCHYCWFISQSSFRKLLLILLKWTIVFSWSKCTKCLSWVHKALMAHSPSVYFRRLRDPIADITGGNVGLNYVSSKVQGLLYECFVTNGLSKMLAVWCSQLNNFLPILSSYVHRVCEQILG